MTQADSLDGLAAAIGAPAEALTETVTRWNSNVESGDDPGNVAAAPTGMVYGGAGGTLGPIITFAYRAGVAASRPGRL